MKQIAALILEHPVEGILLYLRDNKASIPFPHHWDLFGGHVDPGETVEEALKRELREELGLELTEYQFFRKYEVRSQENHDNDKYVYYQNILTPLNELTLYEGERLQYFPRSEIPKVKFANVLSKIVTDYIGAVSPPGKKNSLNLKPFHTNEVQ